MPLNPEDFSIVMDRLDPGAAPTLDVEERWMTRWRPELAGLLVSYDVRVVVFVDSIDDIFTYYLVKKQIR
jgi:hypothetical protein